MPHLLVPLALQVTQYFPRGEQNTSFKWKDYCPCIFSRLREAFGIDNKDYLLSLAGDKYAAVLYHPDADLHETFRLKAPISLIQQ